MWQKFSNAHSQNLPQNGYRLIVRLGCDFEGRKGDERAWFPQPDPSAKTLLSTARLRKSEEPIRAKPRHAGAGRAFPRNTAKPDAAK